MRSFSRMSMLAATLAMITGNIWAQQIDEMEAARKNSKAAEPAISTTAIVAASTAMTIIDISTATLDFSGVDEKDRPIVGGYLQAFFNYMTGKEEKSEPDIQNKAITLTDKQQFAAMQALLSIIPETAFEHGTEQYFTKHPVQFVEVVTLQLMYQSWFLQCQEKLGNEKCVLEKLLPLSKSARNPQLCRYIIESIGKAQESYISKAKKDFSEEILSTIADTMLSMFKNKALPMYLRSDMANLWAQTEPHRDVFYRNFDYLKTEPDIFSDVGPNGIYGRFLHGNMPELADMMFEILENPHKYPAGVLLGARYFFGSDSWYFRNDRNGTRRTRLKKVLKTLAEDRDHKIAKLFNDKRLLSLIEKNELMGRYK